MSLVFNQSNTLFIYSTFYQHAVELKVITKKDRQKWVKNKDKSQDTLDLKQQQ